MACLYYHTNIKTGVIFYVGIGATLKRPYSKFNRSSWWNNYVKKYGGFNVTIIKNDITYDQALKFEKVHIKKHKAKLVNMTDGGRGAIGWKHSEQAKQRNGKAHRGKIVSEETKKKQSESQRKRLASTYFSTPKARKNISEGIKKHWLKRKAV